MKWYEFVLEDIQHVTVHGFSVLQIDARKPENPFKKYKIRVFGFHPNFYMKNKIDLVRIVKKKFDQYIVDLVVDPVLKKSIFRDPVIKILLKESKNVTRIRDDSCGKCGKVFALKSETCPKCHSKEISEGIGYQNTFQADVPYHLNFIYTTNVKTGFKFSDVIVLNEMEKKIPLRYMIDATSNFYGQKSFTMEVFDDMLKDDTDKDLESYDIIDIVVPFFDDYKKYFIPVDSVVEKKIWKLDIETDNANGMDFKKFIYEITHIGFHDNYDDTLYQLENTSQQAGQVSDCEEYDLEYPLIMQNRSIKWKVLKCKTEKILMEKFISMLREKDPDVVQAWNMDRFDKGYMVNRMREMGMDEKTISKYGIVIIDPEHKMNFYKVDIKGTCYFDLLEAYKIYTRNEGMKTNTGLDFTGENELVIDPVCKRCGKASNNKECECGYTKPGLTKIHLDKKTTTNIHGIIWRKDPVLALYYNARDIEIMMELDRKMKITNLFETFDRLSGCLLENTLMDIPVFHSDLIRKAMHEKGFVLPTAMPNDLRKEHKRKVKEGEEKGIEGAFVLDPIPGIYFDVFSLDFKSWYPTIIRILNLSPDVLLRTKSGDCICVDEKKTYFRKDVVGFVVEVIEDYNKGRDLYKKSLALSKEIVKGDLFGKPEIEKFYDISKNEKGYKDDVIRNVMKDIFFDKEWLSLEEVRRRASDLGRNYENYQRAFKNKSVALYGVLLNMAFCLYNKSIAETITFAGRTGIKYVKEVCESDEFKDVLMKEFGVEINTIVIYGHTDSVRVKTDYPYKNDTDRFKMSSIIQKYVNGKVNDLFKKKFNVSVADIEMRTEKIFEVMGMTRNKEGNATKNRCFYKELYELIGDKNWERSSKVDVTGYECIRSNTPIVAAKFQKRVMNMILSKKTQEDVKAIYQKFRKAYLTGRFKPIEMCLNVAMTMDIDDYDFSKRGHKPLPHVRAMMYGRDNIKLSFMTGDKIRHVYVTKAREGLPETDVVGFQRDEDLVGFKIDYKLMFDKTVVSIMEPIVSLFNVKSSTMLDRSKSIFEFASKNLKQDVKKVENIETPRIVDG